MDPRVYASAARKVLRRVSGTHIGWIRVEELSGMPISENSVFIARFNMVMQPDERAKLQRLAEDAKARESELIRRWIDEAYVARFGKQKPGDIVAKYNSAEAREVKAKATAKAKPKTRKR